MLLAPGSAPAATKVCGVGKPITLDDGSKTYLSAIDKRRNITCAAAQQVIRTATKQKKRLFVCGRATRTVNGWRLDHSGVAPALSTRWKKGSKSFVISEQGGC